MNGRIPSSLLGPVPGANAGLLKLAALAYTAMHAEAMRKGTSLALFDGSIGRCYRNFARQVAARAMWCAQGACGNAAVPGTSNHGLGRAVDLMSTSQRSMIDRIGRKYGWSKSWSDASHEWWHLLWKDVGWRPRADPLKPLGRRRAAAARLLLHRRRERREAHRKGWKRREKSLDRAVRRSYKKVERLRRRADNHKVRRILTRVLDDRNGRI